MKTTALVSVDEYLRTAYEPDCDYVAGEVIERNVGERKHSIVQREFIFFFRLRRDEWNAHVFVEQRIQVSKDRYRVPDVCVYVGEEPKDEIFVTPPFICIEILSPEDRLSRTQARIDDYLNFGVPNVWVIDPETRRVWTYSADGSREIKDGLLSTQNPSLAVDLAGIFSGIDG